MKDSETLPFRASLRKLHLAEWFQILFRIFQSFAGVSQVQGTFCFLCASELLLQGTIILGPRFSKISNFVVQNIPELPQARLHFWWPTHFANTPPSAPGLVKLKNGNLNFSNKVARNVGNVFIILALRIGKRTLWELAGSTFKYISRRCIGCKPFVSSENGIQSKGGKIPEWSSVESVQSVQYNDEKWKPLIKLTFPWYFWHLTLFAASVTLFPQMQSLGVRTAPETFATQHWVASQPYWNGDVKLPKNADLMSSCPVSSSNMSKHADRPSVGFCCFLHLELPNSKVHITSSRTHETPQRSVQQLLK